MKKNDRKTLLLLVFYVFLGTVFWFLIENAKEAFKDRSGKKEICADRVRNITNNTSADILFKKCMKE